MTTLIPLAELQPERIALVKPSALGDIVHSLPVLTALRRRFPSAHITWIVNRGYEPLLKGHPDLDATLPFDRRADGGWVDAAAIFGRFVARLRQARFDLVIDLQGLLRTGLMALGSGAARRVGLASAREGARWCYTDRVVDDDATPMHAVDRYWRVAQALGAGAGQPQFNVPLAPAETEWVVAHLADLPRPWLMVAAGSRWQTKRWPPAYFAELVRRAQQRFGGSPVFVGGREDQALARAAVELLAGPCRDLTGKTTLPRLAALLHCADVMIANDTGPLHLAVALGRPVVAPYTCTQAALTGPYRRGGAVETRVWCRGSLRKTCPRMECMAELTPDRLWPALEEILLPWARSRQSA